MARIPFLVALFAAGFSFLGGFTEHPAPARAHGSAAARRAAEADTLRRIERAKPPPGSYRVARSTVGAQLGGAGVAVASPNAVERHRFWVVPRSPSHTLSWFKRRIAHEHRLTIESEGSEGVAEWGVELPALSRLVDQRLTMVAVAPLGAGRTALVVETEAVWLVQHEPAETIPTSARSLEAQAYRQGKALWSRRIRDKEEVDGIADALDRLPVAQPGAYSCPEGGIPSRGPTRISLVFDNEGGEAVAEATQRLPAGFCSPMKVRILGREFPALTEGDRILRRFHLLAPPPPSH